MGKTVKASIGQGAKKIYFDMPVETANKVLNLQRIIREQREIQKKEQCPTTPTI